MLLFTDIVKLLAARAHLCKHCFMGRKPLDISKLERQIIEIVIAATNQDGVSLREVSRRSSIDKARLSAVFNFKRAITVTDLEKLCVVIDRRVSSVVKEAEESLAQSPTLESYDAAHELARKIAANPDAYDLAARQHEPDPYEGLGEENQEER